MVFTRDICRISDNFFIFDNEDRIWRKSLETHSYATTIKVLDNDHSFNKIKKIITFCNSNNCIDVEDGAFREIQRQDFLDRKSDRLYIVKDNEIPVKEIPNILTKIMIKKDISNIIRDFEDIFFRRMNKILCFSHKSAPICKFISDMMDDYCLHMGMLGSPNGGRSLDVIYEPPFKPIFMLIKLEYINDLVPIINYFSNNNDISLLIYFDKLEMKVKESSKISIYKGRKLSQKARNEGIKNEDIDSLFIKYIVKKFYGEE